MNHEEVKINDFEAMVTLSNLTTYTAEYTVHVFAITDLYRRIMGKSSVEELLRPYTGDICCVLQKDDPEYHAGDRYREIDMRDTSFENGGFKFGTKVRIDTYDKRRTGLVCIQVGDYPLVALAKESADEMLFTFPNPFFACFTCSKQHLDETVKFIGVLTND